MAFPVATPVMVSESRPRRLAGRDERDAFATNGATLCFKGGAFRHRSVPQGITVPNACDASGVKQLLKALLGHSDGNPRLICSLPGAKSVWARLNKLQQFCQVGVVGEARAFLRW